jgi:hypothetical protein
MQRKQTLCVCVLGVVVLLLQFSLGKRTSSRLVIVKSSQVFNPHNSKSSQCEASKNDVCGVVLTLRHSAFESQPIRLPNAEVLDFDRLPTGPKGKAIFLKSTRGQPKACTLRQGAQYTQDPTEYACVFIFRVLRWVSLNLLTCLSVLIIGASHFT